MLRTSVSWNTCKVLRSAGTTLCQESSPQPYVIRFLCAPQHCCGDPEALACVPTARKWEAENLDADQAGLLATESQ